MTVESSRMLSLAALMLTLVVGCGGKSDSAALAVAKQAMAKGDHVAAVIELKSVLQKAPNQGEARFLLGVALMEQGENAAALLELKKAQDLDFNEETLAPKIARALIATGKFKEVVQSYAGKIVKDAAVQAELTTAVAVAHAVLGQNLEASAAADTALKSNPKFPWALLTKARLVAATGNFDQALELAEQALVPGSPNGDAYMLRGMVLAIGKNDTAGALKAYELAAADPREALVARSALIHALLAQARYPEARGQLAALQKSHPRNPQTVYLDAIVALASKDFARAESIVDQLLRVAPDNTRLLVLGGAASLQRGALIPAEAKLGKVVQTVERAPVARKLLAETFLRMGQPEKSLATLWPLLEQAMPDASALALAGQAHLQAGNAQEAEAMFAAAVKLRPEDVQVRTALALTDLAKGNAVTALDTLENIAAKDSGETADLALISAHLRRREFDAALAAIALLEKKLPTKPTGAHLRGLALRGKGDVARARDAFEAALKVDSGHFASVAALASLDQQEKRPDAARQRLQAAIKLNSKNTSARMALVNLMESQQDKPAEILAAIDEAIRASPTDAAPHVAKIVQLSRMNDTKAAVSAAQNAMAALPQHPDVLDAAGRALANSGDDQQALSAFNKLAAMTPRSALPYLRLADVHAKRGDAAAVTSSLNRAFDAAPESPEVQRRLLANAVSSKDFRSVLAAAKELQKRFPRSAAGHLLEGDAESARKAWPAALVAYRAALTRTDNAGRPQKLVYLTLRASGDKLGADRFLANWLKSNPNDAAFREYLGSEALLRRDFVAADLYFRQALVLQPRNGAIINNLAWLMAERGEKGAVQMAERALELAPGAAPLLDTLAAAQAAEGQIDRAIESQRRALAAMPSQHQYRLNLVKYLIKGGKPGEAMVELDALSKLGGKFAFQAEVAELRKALAR